MKTYVNFLNAFEKELSRKIKKKGLTITVSGPASSGKSVGARTISKTFGLRYISPGKFFREIAKERKIPLEKFSAIREKEIDYQMDRKNLEYAMMGNVVLDGRLTGWVAGNWADVKIYYDCPFEVRAKRARKRDETSFEKSMKNIQERDKEDNKKYKQLYGIDLFDKSIYDIIINNEKLTLEEAKKIVIKLVKDFLKGEI